MCFGRLVAAHAFGDVGEGTVELGGALDDGVGAVAEPVLVEG